MISRRHIGLDLRYLRCAAFINCIVKSQTYIHECGDPIFSVNAFVSILIKSILLCDIKLQLPFPISKVNGRLLVWESHYYHTVVCGQSNHLDTFIVPISQLIVETEIDYGNADCRSPQMIGENQVFTRCVS